MQWAHSNAQKITVNETNDDEFNMLVAHLTNSDRDRVAISELIDSLDTSYGVPAPVSVA